MSLPPIGLHDLALSIPQRRMSLQQLASVRISADPALEKHLVRALSSTGQEAMRFPALWQDTVTMAAEAMRELLIQRADLPLDHLRFLTMGTETSVDMSKAGSSYVLGLLQSAGWKLPTSLSTFQVQQACAGGSLALLTVGSFIQAAGRDDDLAIVLTSDIARYKAPSTAEVTQGAGATALLLRKNPDLLEFDLAGVGFASRDVDDFFRPLGSTIAKVRGGYSLACYHQALFEAFEDHCHRANVKPDEELRSIDAFYFHVPYAHMPVAAIEKLLEKHLGFDSSQVKDFLAERGFSAGLDAVTEIGNLYTGGLYLSLAFGLRERIQAWGSKSTGKKVLLASYGSGNTMAVWTARVAPQAAQTVARWPLDKIKKLAVDAPFAQYQEWIDREFSYETYPGLLLKDPPESGAFALGAIREDGYREYRLVP